MVPMIRVAVIDDHPAIRAGLAMVIDDEHDMVHVGGAASVAEVEHLLYGTRPDVVVLDYHLPDGNGLEVARAIKSSVPAPKIVLYSAYADASFAVPGLIAGVDGIVNKSGQTNELFEAIRAVAGGERALPELTPALLQAAGRTLDAEDLPILGMLVERTAPRDIAAVLRCSAEELQRRLTRMLSALCIPRGPRMV
jgi:two-component system, NarL family, response regulator DevR